MVASSLTVAAPSTAPFVTPITAPASPSFVGGVEVPTGASAELVASIDPISPGVREEDDNGPCRKREDVQEDGCERVNEKDCQADAQ